MNQAGYVFLDTDQVYFPGDIYQHNTEKSRLLCVGEYQLSKRAVIEDVCLNEIGNN